MAAPKTRADYDQLSKIAKQFDQQAEEAAKTLHDLTQKEQVLQGGDWIGQGAQAFYSEMESGIIPNYRRLINALRTAGQVTNTIRELMQGTENAVSSIFKKSTSNLAGGKSTEGMSASGGGGSTAGGGAGGRNGASGGVGQLSRRGLAFNLPSWVNQMLGLGGNGALSSNGDLIDQFVDEIHNARDMLANGNSSAFDASSFESDSDFPSQQILDAVRSDLAGQSDLASQGWEQQGASAGSGGGSGGGSGSGSGAGSGAPSTTPPTDTKPAQTGGGGGGGGGGDQSPTGGGSMGAGASGSFTGQQGLVGAEAGQSGGSGGMFGGAGDAAGSFGAALVAGSLKAAGAGAPIVEVALMVGASAGGLLFATQGGAAGGLTSFAAGQFAKNAVSPLFRSVSG